MPFLLKFFVDKSDGEGPLDLHRQAPFSFLSREAAARGGPLGPERGACVGFCGMAAHRHALGVLGRQWCVGLHEGPKGGARLGCSGRIWPAGGAGWSMLCRVPPMVANGGGGSLFLVWLLLVLTGRGKLVVIVVVRRPGSSRRCRGWWRSPFFWIQANGARGWVGAGSAGRKRDRRGKDLWFVLGQARSGLEVDRSCALGR